MFEAIGVPGIIDEVLRLTPSQSRVVVVGVCMQPDAITPFYGIGKELNLQFVLGYDPIEFAASLRSIAEGEIDVTPMITGEVGIDDVPDGVRPGSPTPTSTARSSSSPTPEPEGCRAHPPRP